MGFQFDSPKSHKNIHQITIEKISSLVTRFHAVLLPKANKTGIYRDLSEEEEYLLTNLDNENPLHSILAGCLAIDSCLSSISQFEQNLTEKVFKTIIEICELSEMCKIEIFDSPAPKGVSMNKIEEFVEQVEEQSKKLLALCEDLPFGDQQESVKKQEKRLVEQNVTFKVNENKIKENMCLVELQKENVKLQEELQFADRKAIELERKLNKKEMQNNEFSIQDGKGQRKYSQLDEEDGRVETKWTQPNSPNNSQAPNIEIQHLKEKIRQYERVISKMREDYNKERKGFMIEIRKLEDELRYSDSSQDRENVYLLQELEEELEFLREERRHDGKIISQMVQKLEGLSVFRENNRSHNYRNKEGRWNLKLSTLLNSRLNVNDEMSQTENRSHSFKRYRSRDRLKTTHNAEIYLKSIPKVEHFATKSNLKSGRIEPILKNNDFNNQILKYSNYFSNQESHKNNSPQVRFEPDHFEKRDIYQATLAESKIGPENFHQYELKSPENELKPNGVHKSLEAHNKKFEMFKGQDLIVNRKQQNQW